MLAFCLTATFFIGITTSGNQSIRSRSEYNPDADINKDGIIDIVDIVTVAISFGATGEPPTWHSVTNFTLSTDNETMSPHFFIQGEKWRINWKRGHAVSMTGWTGFVIYHENEYVIDAFELGELLMGWPAEGVYYVHQGNGNYYIELRNIGMDGISFMIEAYY